MECKVRYFLTYFIHLTLKYILILFITCSRECHVNRPHFPHARKDAKGKETEVANSDESDQSDSSDDK